MLKRMRKGDRDKTPPRLTSTAHNPKNEQALRWFNWKLQVGLYMPEFCLIQKEANKCYHERRQIYVLYF